MTGAALVSACATASTLRTAKTLDEGQTEVSVGYAGNETGFHTAVGIIAYGITDQLEIEGRVESDYGLISPRFQVLDDTFVDFTVFGDIGYGGDEGGIFGGGAIISRQFSWFEPYFSVRYRYYTGISSAELFKEFGSTDGSDGAHTGFITAGSRINIPDSRFFVGGEIQVGFFEEAAYAAWAGQVGVQF